MEYIDGYRRNELKATRIKRRLCAKARLATMKALAPRVALGVGIVLLFLVVFLSFRFLDHLLTILLLLSSWVLLVSLTRLAYLLLELWVAREAEPTALLRLLRAYIRMLLFDAYKSREEALLATDPALLPDAREYAEDYVPSFSEREALMTGTDFEATVVSIVERYVGYLEALLAGEAGECLALRARLREEMAPWRRDRLDDYDRKQTALIEDNLSLILRQIADRRDVYRKNHNAHLCASLLEGALLYPNPGRIPGTSKKLRIPPKDIYESYCKNIEELMLYDGGGMEFALDREHRGRYRALIDACRAFRLAYTTEGCPEIDLDRCEERYRASLSDEERCWACKKKFHARYRSLCPRCNHYVCPKCGKCYCEKYIVRRAAPTHRK